jgi:uncharacterized protein YqfB (UPF0267 family)
MKIPKEDPAYLINFIDIIELMSPEKKRKYTETTLRLVKHSLSEIMVKTHCYKEFIEVGMPFPVDFQKMSELQTIFTYLFYKHYMSLNSTKDIYEFYQLNENKLITNSDLSSYSTMKEIKEELLDARERIELKKMEKSIKKVYENDTWLFIRPLTYEASLKYGSGTKWCTSSKGSPSTFDKYASEGVLIYCINKKNKSGQKYACYMSMTEHKEDKITFWNEADLKIDSLNAGFSMLELSMMLNELKSGVPNLTKPHIDDIPF